jgi:hypothetical protein
LRYVALTTCPEAFRGSEDLRRFVGSVDDVKVGHISFPVFLMAGIIHKRKNFETDKAVNEARHANENPSAKPKPNRLAGPDDRTDVALKKLDEVSYPGDPVTPEYIKDVLQGKVGTEEERMHIRVLAGLYFDERGKCVTDRTTEFHMKLQTWKHFGDARNTEYIDGIACKNQKAIKETALATKFPDIIKCLDTEEATKVDNILKFF